MIRFAEMVDRMICRSRKDEKAWIEAEANRLVSDFGLDAYSEARRRERDANDLETARLWTRVALALAKRTDKRPRLRLRSNGDGRRLHSISGNLLAAVAFAACRTVRTRRIETHRLESASGRAIPASIPKDCG